MNWRSETVRGQQVGNSAAADSASSIERYTERTRASYRLHHRASKALPRGVAGNGKFLTRKLWGIANQHSFGHHGLYTTMREAVLAHAGEALGSRTQFQSLSPFEQDCVIEFLKSLQVLPPSARESVGRKHDE